MSESPRFLTKSRFKLALECPTKPFYAGKRDYLDTSVENSFLATLAEGGYQVGALACLMYPGGIEVDDLGHAAQLERTQALLALENVTIYEAAIEAQGLFVRVDILQKRGDVIELIEVKAKSYDPRDDGDFRGAKGKFKFGFLPYLQDIAFQRYVAGIAFPQFELRSSLMLADKSTVASLDGLNQRLRVRRNGRRIMIEVEPSTEGTAFGWTEADFAEGTVLDPWNLRKKGDLIDQGVLKPNQVTLADLGFDGDESGRDGMTQRHRQWYQCSGDWPGGGEFFLDAGGLQAAMHEWKYPLHFIDFETSAVAIPFTRGHRPYETVAFQFSHHVMQADGRVEHRTQFLEATPGVDPSVPFVRALRDALGSDDGTVFRWAAHENTVLNHLRRKLMADPRQPADAVALIAFIETITTNRENGVESVGRRNMVDLCNLAERYYFDPATGGSSSLKKVLPALMRSSPRLREIYSRPLYGTAEMRSLNPREPVAWWVERDGVISDPYDLLPPVFDDLSREDQDTLEAGVAPELQEGGAAMAAYARLQFEAISPLERSAIETALLKYCELDTLAMVMAVQAWTHDIDPQHLAK